MIIMINWIPQKAFSSEFWPQIKMISMEIDTTNIQENNFFSGTLA